MATHPLRLENPTIVARTDARPAMVTAFLGGAIVAWGAAGGTVDHAQLSICLLASLAWMATRLDPTLIAVTGALALTAVTVLAGGVASSPLAHLGDDTTVLIVGAFVLAKAVDRSGLAAALTDRVIGSASGRFALARLGCGVFATTFLIPATSARASVLVPVVERAKARATTRGAQRTIALMAPLIVVLGAIASPIAAGANLLAIQVLTAQTGEPLSFATWIAAAAPFGLLISVVAVVVAWALFRHDDRAPDAVAATAEGAAADLVDPAAKYRVALVLAGAVVLWTTAGVHPLEPTLVAILAAVLVTLPGYGALTLPQALKGVDWALIVLLAAAAQIGEVVSGNGLVATGVDDTARMIAGLDAAAVPIVIGALALVAMLAHLVVTSRTARAALLLPGSLAIAAAAGLDPAVAALTVAAGTGFCILTPVGSKALLVFAGSGGADLARNDLYRSGSIILPVQLLLTLVFALWVWPSLVGGA